MDSALATVGLPLALVIVMLGLGLGLTPDDFRRTAREPKAVAAALAAQLVVLPAIPRPTCSATSSAVTSR